MCCALWAEGNVVDKQPAVCRDTNMNAGLTWSSHQIRCQMCRLVFVQTAQKHTNHEVFQMFSEQLKKRRYDWRGFWPTNGMTAPTLFLFIHFGLLVFLPLWNQTEPKRKCSYVTAHPLIRTKWTELQVWKHPLCLVECVIQQWQNELSLLLIWKLSGCSIVWENHCRFPKGQF